MTDYKGKRNCSQEKNFDPLAGKSKQICLFFDVEEYESILLDSEAFRRYLDREIELHPELFPAAIQQGYNTIFFLNRRRCLGFICGASNCTQEKSLRFDHPL